MSKILSYRGMLADGAQETILLSTKKGEVGYRIVKFELMCNDPSGDNTENTVKISKDFQDTLDKFVDFSDNRLLAAGYIENHAGNDNPMVQTVIFDYEIFNQDIYISCVAGDEASTGTNYYVEIEAIKLSETQAMVTTLKDIRNNSSD